MTNKQKDQYDLVIVGAGMVGSSLAHSLRHSGLKIALIESVTFDNSTQPSYDDRNLVLALSSQRILQGLDLWDTLVASTTPIKQIHVSEQHRFASVQMSAKQLKLPALAYSVKARDLGQTLLHQLDSIPLLDFICPATVTNIKQNKKSVSITVSKQDEFVTIRSALLVLADGSLSKTRNLLGFITSEKDYGQTAIVSNVTPEISHNFTAYERFNQEGPFALLPSGPKNCGMVFTVKTDRTETCMNMEDGEFLQSVEKRFGRRLGRFLEIGARKSYPIRFLQVVDQYQGRVLLLGNSAHTIHPNAAQGFNLGLRDVAGLSEQLMTARSKRQDIGSEPVLHNYQMTRKTDQDSVIKFTDTLASIFYNDDLIKGKLRAAGMLLTELVPSVKENLMIRAMGLKGKQPTLVRQ